MLLRDFVDYMLDPKKGRLLPTRPYATRLGGFGRR